MVENEEEGAGVGCTRRGIGGRCGPGGTRSGAGRREGGKGESEGGGTYDITQGVTLRAGRRFCCAQDRAKWACSVRHAGRTALAGEE